MSHDGQFAMNWDCQRQGCFNQKKRLKFAALKESLPGRISFSDVDGIVEIKGNLLLLEWKDHRNLCTGQRILFERMTRFCPATVLIVEGDAEFMAVDSIAIVWKGQIGPSRPADRSCLLEMIRDWADWATENPVLHRQRQYGGNNDQHE